MKKRFLCLILVIILILSCFTGCGRSIDNSGYEPTGDAMLMEGQEPEDIEPEEEEEQKLVLAYYPDRSLNPLFGSDYTNRVLMSLMYQPLFAVDSKKNVTPILCGQYQLSSNGRNLFVYLDKKATFSDGTRVTPEDVVASYEYAQTTDYYKNRFTHLLNVQVTEDGTGVLFQMDTYYENFMLLMDIPIVKGSEVEASVPTGTGPYIYDATAKVLQRDLDWWCGDLEIPAKDLVIDLVAVSSPGDVRDAFQFGGDNSVSVVCTNPMSSSFAEYSCDYELWQIESGYMLFIGCNILWSKHFDDGTLRTFLTYAIDRETLVKEAYKGMVTPVSLPCSPEAVYYSKSLAQSANYDALKFIEHLGRYNIPKEDGKTKTLQLAVNSNDSARVTIARSIAAHLTELGLPTATKEYTSGVFRDVIYVGNFDIYLGMTRLSPNMDLSEFFRNYGNMSKGGIANEILYGMCLKALENSGNYYNLYQKLAEDGRIIPIAFGQYNVYAHRGLMPDLNPARDNVFYYSMGKDMKACQIETVYE